MVQTPDHHLETARLILRPPLPEDFEPWAVAMADPEVTQFILGPQSREMSRSGFDALAYAWQTFGASVFSVIERSSRRWVGYVGPTPPLIPDWPNHDVGWVLAREAWGHGYASEGTRAVIEWLFATLRWDEVTHCINPQNTVSKALAGRLGAIFRGPVQLPVPFADQPMEMWVQPRERWQARRTAGDDS